MRQNHPDQTLDDYVDKASNDRSRTNIVYEEPTANRNQTFVVGHFFLAYNASKEPKTINYNSQMIFTNLYRYCLSLWTRGCRFTAKVIAK